MTNESIKNVLETQEKLRRQLEPISATVKALDANSGFQRMIKKANRNKELMRAALGPLEDLRQAGIFDQAAELTAVSQQTRDALAQVQNSFRLPKVAETAKLFREFEVSHTSNALKRYQEQASEIQQAMEAMRTPWLDMEDKLCSIGGFVELQGIGHTLRTMPVFDEHITEALRVDLGDWRDKISWPNEIFTDPLARTSFYAERGLDPALTAFPASAFEQGITIAGLKAALPPFVEAYNFEPEAEEDKDKTAFRRTNAAHDRLQRFETQIRRFIDDQMKAAFGENWIKHQVPGPIRQDWLDKQKKAEDNGQPEWPLIAYADFADYVPIITRKDNWDACFKKIFGRQTFVQESFQRLYPIRICTMHSRLITQDDELYLYVETKRILTVIDM